MTEKELLYYEDAINHEDNTIEICSFMAQNLKDENLKSFIKKEIKKHESIKDKLLETMECVCNG